MPLIEGDTKKIAGDPYTRRHAQIGAAAVLGPIYEGLGLHPDEVALLKRRIENYKGPELAAAYGLASTQNVESEQADLAERASKLQPLTAVQPTEIGGGSAVPEFIREASQRIRLDPVSRFEKPFGADGSILLRNMKFLTPPRRTGKL